MAQNYYLMHHGIKGMKWGVRRTPAQLGHKPSIGSRAKTKLNDPEFQRKAAKAAKIALAVGAMYAGHKVLNNPEAINAGKKVLSNVLAAKGTVKASAIKAITNSSEFKIAKAAGKAGLEGGKKALKFVGSDNFRKTASGIGAIASTAGVLRKQIKDLKNKPEGDTVDKALGYAKKGSAIGESLNTLARGGASSSGESTNSSSSKTDSSGKPKTVFTAPGGQEKFSANRHLDTDDLRALKQYKINHPGMTTKEALDELGWLDKESTITHDDKGRIKSYSTTLKMSSTPGWSFNPMAGCRYIF